MYFLLICIGSGSIELGAKYNWIEIAMYGLRVWGEKGTYVIEQ